MAGHFHLGGRMAFRISSVCNAFPFLSTSKASEPLLAFDLSRLPLMRTGLSYLTRLSTGGIIFRCARPLVSIGCEVSLLPPLHAPSLSRLPWLRASRQAKPQTAGSSVGRHLEQYQIQYSLKLMVQWNYQVGPW